MTPKRIQRKRTKGWKMPPNTVSVTRPGKWGNPFTLKQCYVDAALDLMEIRSEISNDKIDGTWVGYANAIAIQKYKSYLQDNPNIIEMAKRELNGKDLACWCKIGDPCHADILLKIANS